MTVEEFKKLLDNERIYSLFNSKTAIPKRCYERQIETLYQLVSYNGDFLQETKLSDANQTTIVRTLQETAWKIQEQDKDYCKCFESDICDMYLSRWTTGFLGYAYTLKLVNKTRNQYVYVQYGTNSTKIDIGEDQYVKLLVFPDKSKCVEFLVSVPDVIYYKFVLRFELGQQCIPGIYDMRCANSILTKYDLTSAIFFPENVYNKRMITYKYLYNMGLLSKCEAEYLIRSTKNTPMDELVDIYSTKNKKINQPQELRKTFITDKPNITFINEEFHMGDIIFEDYNICIVYGGVRKKELTLIVINNNDFDIVLTEASIWQNHQEYVCATLNKPLRTGEGTINLNYTNLPFEFNSITQFEFRIQMNIGKNCQIDRVFMLRADYAFAGIVTKIADIYRKKVKPTNTDIKEDVPQFDVNNLDLMDV